MALQVHCTVVALSTVQCTAVRGGYGGCAHARHIHIFSKFEGVVRRRALELRAGEHRLLVSTSGLIFWRGNALFPGQMRPSPNRQQFQKSAKSSHTVLHEKRSVTRAEKLGGSRMKQRYSALCTAWGQCCERVCRGGQGGRLRLHKPRRTNFFI